MDSVPHVAKVIHVEKHAYGWVVDFWIMGLSEPVRYRWLLNLEYMTGTTFDIDGTVCALARIGRVTTHDPVIVKSVFETSGGKVVRLDERRRR